MSVGAALCINTECFYLRKKKTNLTDVSVFFVIMNYVSPRPLSRTGGFVLLLIRRHSGAVCSAQIKANDHKIKLRLRPNPNADRWTKVETEEHLFTVCSRSLD